jgi:hypothetical protein
MVERCSTTTWREARYSYSRNPSIWKGGVEEVGVDAAALGDAGGTGEGEEVLEHEVDVVAVVEACPEVDLPSAGPGGAAVAAELERLAGGGE